MKKKTFHIVFLIVFSWFAIHAYSQPGDSIVCDTNLYIHIDCIPLLDSTPLQAGDTISVNTLGSDDNQYGQSVIYYPDSTNIIELSGGGNLDVSPDYTNLEFSVYSLSGSCNTFNVQYSIDSVDEYCILTIDAFEAALHHIDYPETRICIGAGRVLPVTDIPIEQVTFISDPPGLFIDSEGAIVSQSSDPGNYTLTFETEYCLQQDQMEVTILENVYLDLREDTFSICEGSDYTRNDISLVDFTFYDGSETYGPVDELSESGYYIVITDQGVCQAIDTVYVEVVETPVIHVTEQQECDRVILHTDVVSESNTIVYWSDQVTGETIEVFEDTTLFVEVVNEYGCAAYDTVQVDVNILEIVTAQISKEEADCWNEGSIDITASEVRNYIGNYSYRLRNMLTGQLITSLSEVPEGLYDLQVIDERDCIATYTENITILQKCLEEYPVFTPNGDDIEDRYFIPHEGSVKIYNRDGNLIKELVTPDYWDGTNNAGNLLPMGNYFIVTDTGDVVNITIVR
ncbi:MAG: gliding motility-associated C-terminal domain-containing protein [Bacteroidales bacterium]|nr:gliding motility-associated C-terminal domain-containing protein [Bacteroidales bacterium]